jgi:hypothetical protein
MDIILDANTYLAEPRMAGPNFQELFAYLRRTNSRLVIPEVVLHEVLARYRDELAKHARRVASDWATMRARAVSDPGDRPRLDVGGQVAALRKRLDKPAPGVEVVVYDDFSSIDVKELVRRGVNRIRPASAQGEELRDVILWIMVLQYAKASGAGMGFITDDKTFADEQQQKLHPQLADDVEREGVCVTFYRSIGEFIAPCKLT